MSSLIADFATSTLIGAYGASGVNAGREQFKTTYEVDAIILFGGIAGASYANSLKIGALMGGMEFKFRPIPGGSVGSNQVATYPFANQAIAANAIIRQPLRVSMMMISPASSNDVGYLAKNGAMLSLINSLNQHDNLGGYYSVVTPGYTYTNCLRLDMYDASDERSRQAQFQWRIDFYQPLVTLLQAQQAQSTLMQALTNGAPVTNPSWNGQNTANPPQFSNTANVSLDAPSASQ